MVVRGRMVGTYLDTRCVIQLIINKRKSDMVLEISLTCENQLCSRCDGWRDRSGGSDSGNEIPDIPDFMTLPTNVINNTVDHRRRPEEDVGI